MDWLNTVSNKSLCDWFFVMFVLNCIVGIIMILRLVSMVISSRPGLLFGSITFILTLVAAAIPIINGAFFYALCDRALPNSSLSPIKTNERNLVFGTF